LPIYVLDWTGGAFSLIADAFLSIVILVPSLAKNQGVKALKVIHGYGSSGVGGRLKRGILEFLAAKKKEGFIKAFVPDEDWSIFNQITRDILEQCNDLRKDNDLGNSNHGITIVLI